MMSFKEFVTEIEKEFGEISSLRITYPDGTMCAWRKRDGKFYAYKKQSSRPTKSVAKIKSTKALYSRD